MEKGRGKGRWNGREVNGSKDGLTDGRMGARMDGRTDRCTDESMAGWTDEQIFDLILSRCFEIVRDWEYTRVNNRWTEYLSTFYSRKLNVCITEFIF